MTLLRNVVVLFSLASGVVSTCYWPTGNETYGRDLTEHQPCSNDTTSPLSTICCALNRTNPSGGDVIDGRTNDECLPNGVCRNRVLDHGTMEISYWRETCTSKDWKTGLCLDVCADDWTSGNGTTGAVMTPCDGTATSLKWCCGVDTSCCDDSSKVKTLAFEFRGAIPNTASASYNPFTTPTSSATSTPTSSSNSNASSGGLSTGAKAGIGVGAAIGGIALLALGFFLARRTANKPKAAPEGAAAGTDGYHAPPGGYDGTPQHGYVGQHAGGYDALTPPVQEKTLYPHEMEHRSRSELEYSPASPGYANKHVAPSYEMPS
ncbi:hypothetical protein K491DRAFT_682541 [Lophiostoma macrostomum CBS 122681]|uniref:Mid2 domain-containing protein n=1 Tax=Lophiostoma macrostomum CBS 122681 TaxID=1314788 RepID=A0A6A6STA1_9PLEO|nr:hypothetical protein K491DRAFT_682541 [Lophiostoma macrostomum CBS 122681]